MKAENDFRDRIKEFISFKITRWSNSESTDSSIERNGKQETGHVGLKNLGSTCYMNSAIQQISSCNSIVNLIFNASNESGNALPELKQVLSDLHIGDSYSDPTNFVKHWKGWDRQCPPT